MGHLDRAKALHSAMHRLKPIYGPSLITGMYRCQDIEEQYDALTDKLVDGIVLEDMNLCAVCVGENDDLFTNISSSSYDGDCDECGGDAFPYVLLELSEEDCDELLKLVESEEE